MKEIPVTIKCPECEKYFTFTTAISFTYDPRKADCLNGAEHKWEMTRAYPKEYRTWRCKYCDETKSPTPEELETFKQSH